MSNRTILINPRTYKGSIDGGWIARYLIDETGLPIPVVERPTVARMREQTWLCEDCSEEDCVCECGELLTREQAECDHLCNRCSYLSARC
jgi:hypothetical protein